MGWSIVIINYKISAESTDHGEYITVFDYVIFVFELKYGIGIHYSLQSTFVMLRDLNFQLRKRVRYRLIVHFCKSCTFEIKDDIDRS